jgi:hypothetical protein
LNRAGSAIASTCGWNWKACCDGKRSKRYVGWAGTVARLEKDWTALSSTKLVAQPDSAAAATSMIATRWSGLDIRFLELDDL